MMKIRLTTINLLKILNTHARIVMVSAYFPLIFLTLLLVDFTAVPCVTAQSETSAANENYDDLKILDSFLQRANLFKPFIEEDITPYSTLFHHKNKEETNMTVSLFHRDNLSPAADTMKENGKEFFPYTLIVGDQIASGGNRNVIMLRYRNDDKKKSLAAYAEITQLFSTEIVFFNDGTPKSCFVKYYDDKIGWFNEDKKTHIEWDKTGNIVLQENDERLQKLPSLSVTLQKSPQQQRCCVQAASSKTKDSDIAMVLKRAQTISIAKNIDDVLLCSTFPLFEKKTASGMLRVVNGRLQSIAFFCEKDAKYGLSGVNGYYLSWYDNYDLGVYAEGDISTNLLEYCGKNKELIDNRNEASIDGTGIEVKFHSTGYPSSYKTIVRNRLFGRQMEWNDKGEVISDIDLDIPKSWADAPKKPAAPVVMRTWTSSGGKYRIRAEYVSADENQVMLKNEEGKIFPVALPKLSTDDQNYVKEQLAAKPELLKRGK